MIGVAVEWVCEIALAEKPSAKQRMTKLQRIDSPDAAALDPLCEALVRLGGELDRTERWPSEQLRLCGEAGVAHDGHRTSVAVSGGPCRQRQAETEGDEAQLLEAHGAINKKDLDLFVITDDHEKIEKIVTSTPIRK